MKTFLPEFQSDKEKLIVFGMILGSLFLIFIPSLVVILYKKNSEYISDNTYEIAKSLFNFEIFLFIISLFFFIPIIGWIAKIFIAPILLIWNAVIVIMNVIALTGESEFKIPEIYKFI